MLFKFISDYYTKLEYYYTENKQVGRGLYALAGLALLSGVPGCIPEAVGQSTYPTLVGYTMPSPAPTAPGDAFAPTMGGAAAAAAPAGAEWTRTAGPDETILLTGSRLSKYSNSNLGKDSRFVVYDGTAALKQANVQRVDSGKAVITLPANTAQWGMYLVWPGNENGYGKPVAINQTDAWWVGPEKATRGATVSVFGRNLAHNNDTLASYVFIKPSNGTGQWATVKRVNPYKVDFVVPANLADGDYEVWTHNGHGQQYGWSGPLKLTVYAGVQWAGLTLNVRSFGATGNGSTDDTQAIGRALTAASRVTGATVYFPAGTYLVSDVLDASSNTRWKGDGANSIIKCSPNFSTTAEAFVRGTVNQVEIRDLAFVGNKNYHGTQPEPIFLRGSQNLWLTNLSFSFGGYSVLQLDRTNNTYVTNCELIGKTSFLGSATQLFINACRFKLTDDSEMGLDSWGGTGISLTNSTCQDYDNSNINDGAGWGKGRFYAGRGNFGSSRFTYVGNNRTIDLAVRPVGADQNSGEQFMWEGYSTDWAGAVTSSTATTTTLAGFSAPYANSHYAIITKGTGLGQSRRVTSYSGGTITLESAWNLPPDNTSVVALANVNDRAVMYNNALDGKAYAVAAPDHNASAGIEPYGATVNFIAANNTMHELRTGIANWATQNQAELDPNYFGLYVNNRFSNCRWDILNGLYMSSPREAGLFGTTYRSNQATGTVQSAIASLLTPVNGQLVLSYFIYEHNTLQTALKGYSTGGDIGLPVGFANDGQGIASQIFYKNIFASTTGAAEGIKATATLLVRENSLSGFTQPYAATVLQGEVEAPLHVAELAGQAGATPVAAALTLWNSGTKALSWTATSDAAWLTLPVASGTIAGEQASGTLQLLAAPANLTAGSYRATISVTTGGRVKKYTVLLEVAAAPTAANADVSITSPADGGQAPGAASIVIEADAQLTGGSATIQKVEFYVDGLKVGESTTYPYKCQWANPLAGPHTLTAQLTTTDGATATSAPAEITIGKRVAMGTSPYKASLAYVRLPAPAENTKLPNCR